MADLTREDTIDAIIEAADPEVILDDLYQFEYLNVDVDLTKPLSLLTDADLQTMFAKHVLDEDPEDEKGESTE